MITIILLLFIIFIPSFYIAVKKNIDVEKIIPCTIFSIILIIYLFGLINLLKFGVYFIFILAIGSLILLCINFMKNKVSVVEFIKTLFKPTIFLWIVGIITLFFYYEGRMLIEWDEFSHWGDVVKMMYYNNIYNTNPASLSAARAYPPVMSIFQYFVENISFNGYKEHYLFCAYQTFVISLFLPFIKNIKWREIFKIIIIVIVIILAPILFFSIPFYYNSIYIDPFLGILFGYIMANIFINKEYNKFQIISISLALFTLTLTKDIAPVFSLLSILYVFFDLVIINKNYKFINRSNFKLFIQKLKPIWIFLIVVVASYLSWKINAMININNLASSHPSTIKDVIKALLHYGGTYRVTVVDNYVSTLRNYRFIEMGNIYIITLVMIIFSMLIYKNEKKDEKKKSFFGFLTMYLGEFLYLLLMVILYILMFSEYEALNLASFGRYIGIYLIAILYFLVFITIFRSIEQKKYTSLIVILFILLLNINIPNTLSNFKNYKKNNYKTQMIRKDYIKSANYIRKKIGKNKKYKFYIIVQNSSGLDKWILRYEIRDILKEINEGFNWSLGEKYDDDDIWTLDISKKEFKSILFKEKYDYVFLYRVDKKFINRYGSIFDYKNIKSGQLYKVNRSSKKIEIVN